MPIQDLLKEYTQRFSQGNDTPSLDAQVLLAHVLGRSRAWVIAHSEEELTDDQRGAWQNALSRLESGESLPYVLGEWEFFGLDFSLTPGSSYSGRERIAPAVLIPRPETELLVERALEWLKDHPNRRLACDVGTGSGCIAVSLAAHTPGLHILATDISLPALKTAQINLRRHAVEGQVNLIQADLLPPGAHRFDLVCANLPYIPTHTLHTLEVYAREPIQALDGGLDGLVSIRRLLQSAPRRLLPGGLLLLEIEASQGPAVQTLARAAFPGAAVRLLPDLAGRDRLVEISLPE